MMEWTLKQTVAPTAEPVTLAEAKSRLRLIDFTDDDADIEAMIKSAREYCETYTDRQFMTATWQLQLSEFPSVILVPKPPMQSVTTFAYLDTAGTSQTVTASLYTTDTSDEPATIREAYSQNWPTARDVFNAVTLTYVAGWASAALVPYAIKQAILAMVAMQYEIREPVIVGASVARAEEVAQRFLDGYRTFFTEPCRCGQASYGIW